mgnify:CR=1 FL=1
MRANVKQVTYNPRELGLNGVTFSASRNSSAFGVDGFNQMTIHYEVTRVAATDLSFYIAGRPVDTDNYGRWRVGDIDFSTGIETSRLRQILIPDMAVTASQVGDLHFPLNQLGELRFEAIVGAGATTDTVLFWVTLGVV